MEIEAQMAEDKEREAQRLARAAAEGGGVGRVMTRGGGRPATGAEGGGGGRAMTAGLAVRKIATQGAVRRPVTPRVGRGGGF